MATPLDTGLLSQFSIIFPFLLVFCVIYAILDKTKVMGENRGIEAIIALVCGILVLFFPIVRETLNVMAPWFVLLIFAFIFIALSFMAFGISEGNIVDVLRSSEYSYINTWVAGFGILIVFGSIMAVVSDYGGLGKTQGEGYSVTAAGETGTQESAFWKALSHPKVLGTILILLIGALTVTRLAAKTAV